MLINIILWLLFGALIGWLAGAVMKSKNGWVINIIVGIVGNFIGGIVAGLIGIGSLKSFSIAGVLFGVIGSCILIALVRLISGKKR